MNKSKAADLRPPLSAATHRLPGRLQPIAPSLRSPPARTNRAPPLGRPGGGALQGARTLELGLVAVLDGVHAALALAPARLRLLHLALDLLLPAPRQPARLSRSYPVFTLTLSPPRSGTVAPGHDGTCMQLLGALRLDPP